MTTNPNPPMRYFFAGLQQLIDARSADFVGREDLLASLLSLANTEGDGGVRVITGPPGSGKTSLLCRLIKHLEDVRPIYHIVGRDSGRDKPRLILQSLVEQITNKYGFPLPVGDDLDVLARDFANLLVEIDRRGRNEIVIIDGLDEIDITPLQRVVSILPAAPPNSARIFLSARSGTVENEIIRALGARRIMVDPLNLSETVRYAAKTRADISFEQVADLHQAAEGNPLVLGLLLARRDENSREPLISSGLDRMAAAIERVVDRTGELVGSDVAADVLGVVHVGSGEIDRRDLAEILDHVPGHDLRRALDAIDELLDRHTTNLAYFHKSVHDYLRDRFSKRELTRFHTLIVDWLSHESLEVGGRRSTLINHLLHCGQLDAALHLLSDRDHLIALRRGLGDGLAFQEWFDDWELAFKEAGPGTPASALLARSLSDTVGTYFQYFHDNAVLVRLAQCGADRILDDLARSTPDDADRSLTLFILGAIQYHCGDMASADRYFEAAEQLIERRAPNAAIKFRVHQFRGLAAQYSGRFDDALRHYDRSRAEAASSGHPLYHVFSHSCAGNTLTMQARPDLALVEQTRALGLLRDPAAEVRSDADLLSQEHYDTNVASALTRLAESHLALGSADVASDLLDEAREIYQSIETKDRYYLYFIQVYAEAQLARYAIDGQASLEDVRTDLWDAFVLCRTPSQRARSLRVLASCAILDQSIEQAIHLAEQALALVPDSTAPVERMRIVVVLGQIAATQHDSEAERRYREEAHARAVQLGISITDFDKARDPRVSIPTQPVADGRPENRDAGCEGGDGINGSQESILIILDCDGVLVDSEPIAIAHAVSVFRRLGWELGEEEFVRRFVGRSDTYMRDVVENHLGHPIIEWDEVYTEILLARLAREAMPVRSIINALDEINFRTCVASSGTHRKIRTTLGAVDLLERFSGRIYSSQDVENGKPAPDLFLHAARSEGVDPRSCIVVEDSPTGALAARAAGMACVGYVGLGGDVTHFDGTGAVVILSMDDLPAAIRTLASEL